MYRLCSVQYLVGIGRLVVEREGNGVRKGPFEQGVVFTGQDFYVNRNVGAFTRSVAIKK